MIQIPKTFVAFLYGLFVGGGLASLIWIATTLAPPHKVGPWAAMAFIWFVLFVFFGGFAVTGWGIDPSDD